MNSKKIIAGVLLGAAAGVAAALFFETEKGKQVLADLQRLAEDTVDNAKERWVKVDAQIKNKLLTNESEA